MQSVYATILLYRAIDSSFGGPDPRFKDKKSERLSLSPVVQGLG